MPKSKDRKRCSQCTKQTAMMLDARGGHDGRPLWGCLHCGARWTEGNPYAAPGSDDRLTCLANSPKHHA